MTINIFVIPHANQRYDTVGDWMFDSGNLTIYVSDMNNPDYEFLVARHEMDEAFLCLKRGITGKEVDAFDMAFTGTGEPGDSPDAPYRKEHFFATTQERTMAAELDVDWEEYDKTIEAL